MKLKSYFSGTVEAAMELARKELGEDALLVNARPATPETRYLGDYEVVFGVAESPGVQFAAPGNSGDRLAQEVAELKREFERITQSLRQSPPPEPQESVVAEPDRLHARLIAQDLDPSLIEGVLDGRSLTNAFKVDASLGVAGSSCRIAVFIGPPGVGKTTALVKLAAHFGLTARSTQILTSDVQRIAAASQLQTLASLLGVGCEVAETAADLEALLQEHHSKELILIDTPGLIADEMQDAQDLIQLLRSRTDVDTHLVLPAYLRASDMSRFIQLYSCFSPKKLLFTHLDETIQFGPVVGQSVQWSLPISFLCTGQRIPNDLEAATRERLEELVMGEERLTIPAAALARPAAALSMPATALAKGAAA